MILRTRLLAFVAAAGITLLLVSAWSWADHSAAILRSHRESSFGEEISDKIWREINESHDESYFWRTLGSNFPISEIRALPTAKPTLFPNIQVKFPDESEEFRKTRLERQKAVKDTFTKSWIAYRKHAWMADELEPVSGGRRNPFGGWAASLVDALDTLWIMNMHDEFREAVDSAMNIDFTKSTLDEVNVFETTIRYLGGFLSAFELSQDARLLRKAVEVGDMIYKAFDTPNHLPVLRWDVHAAANGEKQKAGSSALVAEIGSLCMELSRLSQWTGDAKWYDAAQRITDHFAEQRDTTELPGMWPLVVDPENGVFNSGSTFTLGAMADSLYEYLPKMAALMGGQLPIYQSMYEKAVDTAAKHNFFRPMTPTEEDILVSTQVKVHKGNKDQPIEVDSQGQHLVCFIGGMLAMGGKMFSRPQDVELAAKLTGGCVYAYKAFPHGIMPETMNMVPCPTKDQCPWDEALWKAKVLEKNGKPSDSPVQEADAIIAEQRLPKGWTMIPDRRYILRPEAIESVFIMYRATARPDLFDSAWDMFTAIDKATKTDLANTAVRDITKAGEQPPQSNSMESFWMGETLKYFYLMFSEPDHISLDDFVFNTEAHPLRRLR